MDATRRQVLRTTGATVGAATIPIGHVRGETAPSCYDDRAFDHPTPNPPDQNSHEAVISEAYGELVLSSDRPYWVWPICYSSEPITVEYEVRPTTDAASPSVVVVDDEGLREYKTVAMDHPVVDGPVITSTTTDLDRFGTYTLPTINQKNIHPWNLLKPGSHQKWTQENGVIEAFTLSCLNSSESGAIQKHHTIEGGQYYIVFDWTDQVLTTPDADQTSIEVSLRATKAPQNPGNEIGAAPIAMLYSQLPDSTDALVDLAVGLAETVCEMVPSELERVDLTAINKTAPRAAQLVSVVSTLLTVIENQLGYFPSFGQSLTATASKWTRWGLSVLPVASSINHVIDDACIVAENHPSTITTNIENLLMSLGILIADLLLAKFGVAGRAARFVTGFAHRYLLGFVARTLGMKAYLVLLRDLYTLTQGGIGAALGAIKGITREITQRHDLISEDQREKVMEMEEDSLISMDIDIDWFSLNPECDI